jgi:hypothetical protein
MWLKPSPLHLALLAHAFFVFVAAALLVALSLARVVCRQSTEAGKPAAAPEPTAARRTDSTAGGDASAPCNDGSSGEDTPQHRKQRRKMSAPKRKSNKVVPSDDEEEVEANVRRGKQPIDLDEGSPSAPPPRGSLEVELRANLDAFLLELDTFEDYSSAEDLRNVEMTGATPLLVSQVLSRDEKVQELLLRTADGGSTPEFAALMESVRAADRRLVAAILAVVDKAERTTHSHGQNLNVRWFEVPFPGADGSLPLANNGGLVGLEGPHLISTSVNAHFVFHVNSAGLCHSYRLSSDEAEELVRRRQEIIGKHTVPSPRQRPDSSDTATPKQKFRAAPLDADGAADDAGPCGSSILARPPASPSVKVMQCQLRIMVDQLRPFKETGQGKLKEYKHFGTVAKNTQELTLLGALVRALPM